MQTILYPQFYQHHGIRAIAQLIAPPLDTVQSLELPIGSIYHYVTTEGVELGPPSNDFLFRHIAKPIQVGHVTQLSSQLGTPKRTAVMVDTLMREYQHQNRRMRWMKNLAVADSDQRALIVYNYALLAKSYRYTQSFFSEYYKWYNMFATVMDNIAATVQQSTRQHFILTSAPKVIPSVQQLESITQNFTQQSVKILRDQESWLLLEIWRFLSEEHRSKSLLSKVPVNRRHLVNFIYQEAGQWVTLCLGRLDAFIKPAEGQTKLPEDQLPVLKSRDHMDIERLRKRTLRFYMAVMEARTLAIVPTVQDTTLPAKTTAGQPDEQVLDEDASDQDQDDTQLGNRKVILDPNQAEPTEPATPAAAQVDDEELTDQEREQRMIEEDKQIEEDLAQLNEIAQRQEEERFASEASLAQVIYQDDGGDLSTGVMSLCDRLADDGVLSAAEYKRFQMLSKSYEKIPAPLGAPGNLGDFSKVPAETLVIKQSDKLPDSPTIVDKSMTKSSLVSFDDRYITEVLEKDVAGMALGIQRAGVAVTDYQVEEVTDALGTARQYTLRVAPVVGQPSTLRFKLPVVGSDGTYMANGVKYRLRKQRGD